LDFGGVDIIVDKYGIPYVLEINSAPSQTSPYRQQCVAKVFDYIVENGKETISLGSSGKYLRYIHPAIEPKAIVL
jgi:predicted ATP-grasp superfamily ATP-dependent carboligase